MRTDVQGNVIMWQRDINLRQETLDAIRWVSDPFSFSKAAIVAGVSIDTFMYRFHRYFGTGKIK